MSKRSIINTATRGDEAKQSIATPWALIHALERRFGVPVDFDLCATDDNKKVRTSAWFGPGSAVGDNALMQDWSSLGATKLAFANVPFGHIKPWALGPRFNTKAGLLACRWLPRWTVMLAPASHSTDWFLELKGKVQIDAIPRLQFETQTHLFPKDLAIFVAGFGVSGSGYWDWRASYLQHCRERDVTPDPVHMKGLKRFPEAAVLPDYSWTPSPFREPAA
ncbi:DNA N-6-adenine-methyltransferase [Caudoviricetes sp.]|nr:DNA N-6-adenine-methyltransferase [Caudoviricetes sp.]